MRIYCKTNKIFLAILSFILTYTYASIMYAFGIVVIETDFGQKNTSTNVMKGTMYGIDSKLLITDLTNNITPYNIWEGAYHLFEATRYWPQKTVFIFALESSPRKNISIVAKSKSGQYFIGPDNGFLTLIERDPGLTEVRMIANEDNINDWRVLYSQIAAKLASGELEFEKIGPVLNRPLMQLPYHIPTFLNNTLNGEIVLSHEPFGNIWTNIPQSMANKLTLNYGECFNVTILNNGVEFYSKEMPFVGSFDQGMPGKAILYFNNLLNLSVAINQGSFMEQHKIGYGPNWTIKIKKGVPNKCLKNLAT